MMISLILNWKKKKYPYRVLFLKIGAPRHSCLGLDLLHLVDCKNLGLKTQGLLPFNFFSGENQELTGLTDDSNLPNGTAQLNRIHQNRAQC